MACKDAPAKPQKHKLKLKGSIGQGAFGQIYKGLLDGEVVACKTMAQTQAPDCEANAQMFFREAEVMKACHHKRIIAFKTLMRMPASDSKLPEPSWALVMEFARHGNLGQRVAQQMTQPGRTSYSYASALGWALDIASALEYLHMRSPAVLHRDVKSANIMLADDEGAVVAKLADFGLHVFADDSKHRTLQTTGGATFGSAAAGKPSSSSTMVSVMVTDTPAATDSSSGSARSAGQQQQQQRQQPSPVSPPAAAPNVQAADQSSTARPPLQVLQGNTAVAAAAADDRNMYSEVHDSGGSRVYVSSSHSTSEAVPARRPPGRNSSFRRAVHHPPGEALPRIMSNTGEPAECDADANARLFAHWGISGSVTAGSMCSLVSQGTWATNGTATSGTDTAGSNGTDDTGGSILDEVETVFNMTGRTGSCLYMAPEVYQNHSYNEKSDVFSFGVVMYELFAKCLVVFTELPTCSTDPELPVRYAHKVAAGYRPSRSKSKLMTDTMWSLISACWQQDPLLRPHMSEVVAVLSAALSDEVSGQLTGRKARRSMNLRSSTLSDVNQQHNMGASKHGTMASAAADAKSTSAPAAYATSDKVSQQSPGATISSSSKGTGSQAQEGPQVPAASQGCGCVIS